MVNFYGMRYEEETAYRNTPEQRLAALRTVEAFLHGADLRECVAMLGLADV